MSSLSCDTSGDVTAWTDLRIPPVFTIWVTGTLSTAFPIIAYRSSVTRVSRNLFEYAFLAWCPFHHSQIGPGSPNISVLVSSSLHRLSTSSPPPLASSPHRVLEPHGILMCALYLAIFLPIIPILICFRNVALPPDAYFPNVLHDLCFWNSCIPHWHGQAHEAWYPLWYVDHDFRLIPFPSNLPSPFSCLGTNSLSSPNLSRSVRIQNGCLYCTLSRSGFLTSFSLQ